MRHESIVMNACGALVTLLVMISSAHAEGIGQVKNTKGAAVIVRDSHQMMPKAGDALQLEDVIRTGPDGSVGVVFKDNSMISVGPNTELALKQFEFNNTTHVGTFNSTLQHGTLAVKSGKIVAKTPEAMKVNTPTTVLAVRGTEFLVRVDR